jgi:hypothetical protein
LKEFTAAEEAAKVLLQLRIGVAWNGILPDVVDAFPSGSRDRLAYGSAVFVSEYVLYLQLIHLQ